MVPEQPYFAHVSLDTWVNGVTPQSLPVLMIRTLVTTAGRVYHYNSSSALTAYFYSTCVSSDPDNSSFVCECDGQWSGHYCTGILYYYTAPIITSPESIDRLFDTMWRKWPI